MKINTLQHLSDEAKSVTIDRSRTVWSTDDSVITLQDALNTLQPISIQEVFATDSSYGLVKIARDEDLENGVGTGDVITSEQLLYFKSRPYATHESYGTTIYASDQEVIDGVVGDKSITPLQLGYKWDNHISKVDQLGTIKLSHESMVIPGVDNTTAMTPKLVKYAIDRLVPSVAIATEDTTGTVILSNIKTTQAGQIREGYAVSPFSFRNTNATENDYGTVRMATLTEAKDITLDSKVVITPKIFNTLRATTTQVGTIKTASENDVKAKLSDAIAVTPKSIGYLLNKIDSMETQLNGVKNLGGFVPIGTMIESFSLPPVSTGFVDANGRALNKNQYPELFTAIGYRFGGSGDWFNIPDMRGLYTRSYGKGKNITGALGNVTGGNVGTVQAQQVRRHKHVGSWGVDDSNYFGASYGRFQGSGRHDWNNNRFWTNDGYSWNGNPNPDGTIGEETRPWSISVYKLIRIK